MNPIIFIDELDKISKTEHGKELVGILTHLTDSTQNQEFADKYFSGIKIDLSKVLFIFSYNNPENIDPILLDRIHRVKFKSLKRQEKIHISKFYMIPEICKIVGFDKDQIIIGEDIIEKIIEQYTYEPGVRKLRERFTEIVREVNLRYITNESLLGNPIVLPFTITMDHLDKDIFSQRIKMKTKKILDKPMIGLVNGLYATTAGLGGITVIEAYKIHSNSFLTLELTGQQGDVMKESMKVAKTVAWNTIEQNQQSQIKKDSEISGNKGIHIHCPEGATPKDGPSAGLAITTAIISLLTQIPVNNKVGMTGEIDLNGSSHEIGGLESKLYGARKAGIEHVLIPRDNENDYLLIKNEPNNQDLVENLKITFVDSIWDVLKHALINNNNTEFIQYTDVNKKIPKKIICSNKIDLQIENIPQNYSQKDILWKQVLGPNTSKIGDPHHVRTQITNLIPGEYIFDLKINYYVEEKETAVSKSRKKDKNKNENLIIVDDLVFNSQIIIENLSEPFINLCSKFNIIGDTFNLNDDKIVYNPEKIIFSEWSTIESPENSKAIIKDSNQINTTVSNLSSGDYLFQLKLEDKDKKIFTYQIQLEVYSKYFPIITIV